MENFNNLNQGMYQNGCGEPSYAPVVITRNPGLGCPTDGYAQQTIVTPQTTIQIGLTQPTATFRIAATLADRDFILGAELSEMCLARLADELGVTPLPLCSTPGVVMNNAAQNFCCYLEMGGIARIGMVAKPFGSTSGDVSEITGSAYAFLPCEPCFTSDVVFNCDNGCGNASTFILSGVVTGKYSGILVHVPANVGITFNICSCEVGTENLAGCGNAQPHVAPIVAGPVCVPNGFAPNGMNGARF